MRTVDGYTIQPEADLSEADLSEADLSEADLSEADLRWADLAGADLRWANLTGANLTGADLAGADLAGADLTGTTGLATWEAECATLEMIRTILLARPERCQMGAWHGYSWDSDRALDKEIACGTAHCIAGWAQVISQDHTTEAAIVGSHMIPHAAFLFYQSNQAVLNWLERRGWLEQAPNT